MQIFLQKIAVSKEKKLSREQEKKAASKERKLCSE